jgi:hypothetical protein
MLADSEVADEELVLLARRGDAGALGQLLSRHLAGMMAVALSVLPRYLFDRPQPGTARSLGPV